MKIPVLGATGSGGRLLVAEGLKRGHRITALVRKAKSAPLNTHTGTSIT